MNVIEPKINIFQEFILLSCSRLREVKKALRLAGFCIAFDKASEETPGSPIKIEPK